MKLKIWKDKREIEIKKDLTDIAKEANYNITVASIELDLLCEEITEESMISDIELNRVCNRLVAEDILTMQDIAKTLENGSIARLLKENQ